MHNRTLLFALLGSLVVMPVAAAEKAPKHREVEAEEETEGREVEPFYENRVRQFEFGAPRSAPFQSVAPGAYPNAVRQTQQLKAKPPKVNGVAGTWTPIGVGPMIANAEQYPQASGLGLVHVAGRLDSLHYDAANGRLFATTRPTFPPRSTCRATPCTSLIAPRATGSTRRCRSSAAWRRTWAARSPAAG